MSHDVLKFMSYNNGQILTTVNFLDNSAEYMSKL